MTRFLTQGMTGPGRVLAGDVVLNVDVVGHGDPVVVMHGGPSGDLWTMLSLRALGDRHLMVFYDHRCNGRSVGPPASTMTWENLTADADALRERLGFDRWTVIGHSFGGHVALEYALRHPERVDRLILMDTGADARWARDNAPRVALRRAGPEKAELVRRWFHGELTRRDYVPIFWRIGDLYFVGPSWRFGLHDLLHGAWRSRVRPEAFLFASRTLMPGWSVVDKLGEVTAPTLVVAGREDFVFPPECQQELADGIPGSRLVLVDGAGHNPHDEQSAVVLAELRRFLEPTAVGATAA